jgi:nitrate/nitrite transporter NarK
MRRSNIADSKLLVLTYIAAYAIRYGIPENTAFYLVSIINASSLFGRLSGGLLADKYGPINVMTPATLAVGILTYGSVYVIYALSTPPFPLVESHVLTYFYSFV